MHGQPRQWAIQVTATGLTGMHGHWKYCNIQTDFQYGLSATGEGTLGQAARRSSRWDLAPHASSQASMNRLLGGLCPLWQAAQRPFARAARQLRTENQSEAQSRYALDHHPRNTWSLLRRYSQWSPPTTCPTCRLQHDPQLIHPSVIC